MGLDQYAYKARRQRNGEEVSEDDIITLTDGTKAITVIDDTNGDGRWYGRKINVIQNYMEKTTNIDNCECVYITDDMLSELEDALNRIDTAVNNDPDIHALISKYITVPDEGITHYDAEYFFNFEFSEDDAELLGEFMDKTMPGALEPTCGFFYGPSNTDSGYYLHQLTEVRRFINTVRPWLTDDTFAVYTCWY